MRRDPRRRRSRSRRTPSRNADFAAFVDGHGARHRRRAVRRLVRLRRPAARRLPAHPGGGPGARGGGRSRARRGGTRRARSSTSRAASDHPVVHVSWDDAAGLLRLGRRPAADRGRVGVRRPRRPRGPAVPVGRRARAGRRAPDERVAGRVPGRQHASPTGTSAPPRSDAFQPNGYGLYNMTGNVWEWSRRLVQPRLPHARPAHRPARPAERHAPHARAAARTCATTRTAAATACRRRNALTPDSSTGNVGFRAVARDARPAVTCADAPRVARGASSMASTPVEALDDRSPAAVRSAARPDLRRASLSPAARATKIEAISRDEDGHESDPRRSITKEADDSPGRLRSGATSPYPTVVTVCAAHHMPPRRSDTRGGRTATSGGHWRRRRPRLRTRSPRWRAPTDGGCCRIRLNLRSRNARGRSSTASTSSSLRRELQPARRAHRAAPRTDNGCDPHADVDRRAIIRRRFGAQRLFGRPLGRARRGRQPGWAPCRRRITPRRSGRSPSASVPAPTRTSSARSRAAISCARTSCGRRGTSSRRPTSAGCWR